MESSKRKQTLWEYVISRSSIDGMSVLPEYSFLDGKGMVTSALIG